PYAAPVTVTITSTTPNVVIYYTTDGSTPNSNSSTYTGPFTISTTSLLQTIATRTGWTSSSVFGTLYRFNYGTLAAPTITPASGTNTSSVTVTMSAMTGATIHYTTDGSPVYVTSPTYTGPFAVTQTSTVTAAAFHPDYTTSPSASATYTIVVATPTLTPVGGTYPAGQAITVATATPGATMTYTLTGVDPTPNDLAVPPSGTLTVGNYTLMVKAWKTGCTPSTTATATYSETGTETAPAV